MSFKKLRDFFSINKVYKFIRHVYKVITSFSFRRAKLSEIDKQLFGAIAESHTENVALLLIRGANPNAIGSFGFRPLLTAIAAKRNVPEIVDLLLKHGADANTVGWFGMTPLNRAIIKYRFEVVDLLLKYGADVNAVDWFGITPWISATMTSSFLVDLLLRHGADVNLKRRGLIPLRFAVLNHQRNKSKDTTFLMSIVRALIISVLLDNINAEKPDFIQKSQLISISWDESKRLLNKELLGTLSLRDLCKEKDENKLALHSQSEAVKKGLEDLNLNEKYPYLSEKVHAQIHKGVARNQALATACKSIFISNTNKKLNESCWKEILKNLAEEDLKNVTKVASLFFKKPSSNDSENMAHTETKRSEVGYVGK